MKIGSFLTKYDFLWSIPLGVIAFFLYPIVGSVVFGDGFTGYDPSIVHAAIYAGLLMVIQNMLVQMGIRFNHKDISREYYDHENRRTFRYSSTVWEKINLYRFWYVFYSLEFLVIWGLLV